jgi:flagellar motility protein MotE (MotC chaperone)
VKSDKAAAKPPEAAVPEKKTSLSKVVLVTSLCWLVLISAVILLIIYDPTEYQDIRTAALLFLNPEEETLDDYVADKIPELLDWERDLADAEAEQELYLAELELLEDELNERDYAVTDREDEVAYMLEELGAAGGSSVVIPDLASWGKALTRATPARAAELLAGLDETIAAQILQTMSDKAVGPILDAMDIDAATLILEVSTEPIELE